MIVVHGNTVPGSDITVNQQAALVGVDGRFQALVTLSPGINVIQVTVTDVSGNQETDIFTINSLPPQPFFLSVTEPEDQSVVSDPNIRVSGGTSQDATVKVNGVTIAVDGQGNFSTAVTLRPGANTIVVEAVTINGTEGAISIPVAVILKP